MYRHENIDFIFYRRLMYIGIGAVLLIRIRKIIWNILHTIQREHQKKGIIKMKWIYIHIYARPLLFIYVVHAYE